MTGPGPRTPPAERFVAPRPAVIDPASGEPSSPGTAPPWAARPGTLPPGTLPPGPVPRSRFWPAAETTVLPVVPPPPRPPHQSRRGAVVAWMIAAAVVILAVGVGAVALTVAAENRPLPPAGPLTVPTRQSTVDSAHPGTVGDPGAAGDDGTAPAESLVTPALIDPSGVFPVHYTRQEFRVQPDGGSCYPSPDSVYLDLDEPRAISGDDTGPWDLSLIRCDAGPAITVRTGVAASRVASPAPGPTAGSDLNPGGCVDLVRRTPVGTDPVPVGPGLTLCVVTGARQAAALGQPRRIALVSVPAVAADGTISLTVSAWDAQP